MSDPIIETPPPIEVEVITGAATPLSADTPEDLGAAAAGVSMEASRSDHVHAMPSAADVGADPAGAASTVAGDLSTHESLTTTAHGGIVGDTDARLTDARTPLAHTHGQSDVTGLVADMAGKQPLDSDLTAIAALSTTAFGRSLLEVVDAVGGRAALSAAAAAHVHDGADITSGVVAPARLGSGTPDASKVLRGDGVWGSDGFPLRSAAAGLFYGNGGATLAYSPWGSGRNHGGTLLFLPAGTYDLLRFRLAAGSAAWSIRMGIYPVDPVTGGLVAGAMPEVDLGTVSLATAAVIDLPMLWVNPVPRWVCVVWHVVSKGGSDPTVYILDTSSEAGGYGGLGFPIYSSSLAGAAVNTGHASGLEGTFPAVLPGPLGPAPSGTRLGGHAIKTVVGAI